MLTLILQRKSQTSFPPGGNCGSGVPAHKRGKKSQSGKTQCAAIDKGQGKKQCCGYPEFEFFPSRIRITIKEFKYFNPKNGFLALYDNIII